jgi:16S rRNA (cytosine1402-N4)-methyltransferase
MKYHEPVLLKAAVDALDIIPNGIYVDLTFGGGGHSNEILSRLGGNGKLFGFDQDQDAITNIPDDARFCFIQSNYQYVSNFLRFYKAVPVNGVLADLGISSWQIDAAERGFSYRFDAPLDMRMNKEMERTAADIVNESSKEELFRIFREYGEINSPVAFVTHLLNQRPIKSTGDLLRIAEQHVSSAKRNKFLAQVFQALRIELNDEISALKSTLLQMSDILAPKGKIVVLSYHSLEDRLVKNLFRSGNLEGKVEKDFYGNPLVPFKLITKKPMIANEDEVLRNPRARSVKMRVAEKI